MVNSSSEEQQILREFERGLRLSEVTRSHGWQDVLDIMEQRVAQAEFLLMNYAGGDAAVCSGLQRTARAMRQFFESIQIAVQNGIEASREIPASLQPTDTAGLRY